MGFSSQVLQEGINGWVFVSHVTLVHVTLLQGEYWLHFICYIVASELSLALSALHLTSIYLVWLSPSN
ncbi:uncharacterized protein BDR25DRAFT_302458 [Lindgomyces ingoldianus]|uniref:Uncharacterized protein n=1 Tax=Lindgomyces ingoldianus TaxID=673940 RepID=A0ACB6R214_9PLEO|nr:uncharacterized protein BDR25DRAFT_302458 [Lindgomyces ingoldianus]KAF2472825.1 hypothetical protein BDR25DRAFT_302458 [Lindgomyces ingoldianus]